MRLPTSQGATGPTGLVKPPSSCQAAAKTTTRQSASGCSATSTRCSRRDGVDKLPSGELAAALCEIETSPWGDIRGKALDARGLARRLKRFNIRPRTIRLDDDTTAKGYPLEVFEDAFHRYLGDFNRHTDTTPMDTGIEADPQTSQVTDANTTQSLYPSRCDGVTDTNAQNGERMGFWLARDGVWRSYETEPPARPGEVIETRYGKP